MSELKVHKAYNRWIDEEMPTPNDDLICNEVYLKSEADKVIAHHKRKRCVAMARWCESENYTACWYHENSERCKWTEKWHRRWLELAEKLKG